MLAASSLLGEDIDSHERHPLPARIPAPPAGGDLGRVHRHGAGVRFTILLAATFTALCYPAYLRLLRWFGGRPPLAALGTLVLLLLLVLAPLVSVLGVAANEALRMTDSVGPRLAQIVSEPTAIDPQLQRLPGYSYVAPYREQLLTKIGELISGVSAFLFKVLSATTRATALFVFHSFVLLYAMYFFLTGGPEASQRRPGVRAAGRRGQAADAGEVRLGDAGHAQGHDSHRGCARVSRGPGILGSRYRGAGFLGHGDGGAVDHSWRRRRAGVGARCDHPGRYRGVVDECGARGI